MLRLLKTISAGVIISVSMSLAGCGGAPSNARASSIAGVCGSGAQITQVTQTLGYLGKQLKPPAVILRNSRQCAQMGVAWQQGARVATKAQMGIRSPGQSVMPTLFYQQQLQQVNVLPSLAWQLNHGPIQPHGPPAQVCDGRTRPPPRRQAARRPGICRPERWPGPAHHLGRTVLPSRCGHSRAHPVAGPRPAPHRRRAVENQRCCMRCSTRPLRDHR